MKKLPWILILCCTLFLYCRADNKISFQINMYEALKTGVLNTLQNDKVVIRGGFNDWQSDSYEMNDSDEDSIYTGTFFFPESLSNTEFKYVIVKGEGTACWEDQPNPENQPYGNRQIIFTGKPKILPLSDFKINRYDLYHGGLPVQFSIEELRSDYNQLRTVLETEHCCLYNYTSKSEFDTLFETQYSKITHAMDPSEFFRTITPLSAHIGCGHSGFWMPGQFWNLGRNKIFPLQIKLIEGQVVVDRDLSGNNQVSKGSVLYQINNHQVTNIVEELKDNYAADAFNENFKLSQIERRFPMLLARMYGFSEKYVVTWSQPGNDKKNEIELAPANIDTVRKSVFTEPVLSFNIIDSANVAILTISSFSYYDRVDFFKGYLDSCFSEIQAKKIHSLILDLRGNDGGDPFCSAPLFSFLANKPVPYFAEPYGKYAKLAEPIQLAGNRFMGNLFTLIDGHCFSTNGHFCALLKYHKIGKLIGSDSGASYECNAATKTVNLKKTQIQIFVAQKSFAAAVKNMDLRKAIMPDHHVTQSYNDFLNGRDTVMDYTLNLIRGNRH